MTKRRSYDSFIMAAMSHCATSQLREIFGVAAREVAGDAQRVRDEALSRTAASQGRVARRDCRRRLRRAWAGWRERAPQMQAQAPHRSSSAPARKGAPRPVRSAGASTPPPAGWGRPVWRERGAGALPGAARACASSAAHRCRWLLSESVKPLKPSVLSTASKSASVTASRPSRATRCRASLTSRLRNSPVQTWTASTASSDRAARGSVLMVCAMTWRTPRIGRDICVHRWRGAA